MAYNPVLIVCIASIGKVGLLEREGYSNQQITALTYIKCNPKFIMYFMMLYTNQILRNEANTSVVPIVNTANLKDIKIPLPPLPEQERIAGYLDERCARIDKLKASIEQTIEALAKYKQSLIFEYVTGKREVPACFGGEDSDG